MSSLRAAREHAEIVANSRGITGAMADTQPPARALPNRVMADVGFNLGIAHPRVVIPRGVVGANVLETKPVIVAEIEPGFGRTIIPPGDAAGMVATTHRRTVRRLENGIC